MGLIIQRILSQTPSSIQVIFTEDLSSLIGVGNITVIPQYDSIPTPQVLSTEVDNNILTVNYSPMFDNIQYQITFFSTLSVPFMSTTGDLLKENGNTNVLFVVSPGENTSILSNMLSSISPVYNLLDPPSLARDIVEANAYQLQLVSNQIKEVKSSNYISITQSDELITRSTGAIDYFFNGGCYEVVRVGSTITNANVPGDINLSNSRLSEFSTYNGVIINPIILSMPADPVSLQAVDVIDELINDNINLPNFFSGLNLQVSKGPIIQVISVALLTASGDIIPYDITQFGYILANNLYDSELASVDVNLGNRDVTLSSNSINGQVNGFQIPAPGDTIKISYVYQKLGRNVNSSTVTLTTVNQSVREVVPAVATSFFLDFAPVVLSNGQVPISGGVQFLNSQAFNGNPPLSTNDPAFLKEIPFSVSAIPNSPGLYSVNYSTGQVFVYGSDATHQGTGQSPAAATYYYQQTFIPEIDYTYYSDISSLALKSNRMLTGISATISFEYEDVFAEGTDFRFLSHIESINEEVGNNLIDTFSITTQNAPITDVFRVFNETTGEIYTVTNFNDTTITFFGVNAPNQVNVSREPISFTSVEQETLILTEELENSSLIPVYQFNLANKGITNSNNNFIGANFDTSVVFSNRDIFLREFFYEDKLYINIQENLNKLQLVGDYLIDYDNGIVYLAVALNQSQDVGDIAYSYNSIAPKNNNVLYATNVYRSVNQTQGNVETYTIDNFTANAINFSTLESAATRFIDQDPNRVLIVGSYENGVDGVFTAQSNVFSSFSATFNISYIGYTLQIGSADDAPVEQYTITNVLTQQQLVVSPNFDVNGLNREWVILNLQDGYSKTIVLDYNISSISSIYSATEVATLPASELINYYNPITDSFSGNTITLAQSNALSLGAAVVIDYNYGPIYADYTYLADQLTVSYEYGPNALDWSISSTLQPGDTYFVTYKYGAMRNALLANFGSLTQIPELTTFPLTFNREAYRSIVAGTIQSFITGPTIPAIEKLVESFTDVQPVITELAFNSWILGQYYLYPRLLTSQNTPNYAAGRFNDGLLVQNIGDGVAVPAISHFRLKGGTLETWVKPLWSGLSNDATLTFNLFNDGYIQNPQNIYIGFEAVNPPQLPIIINQASIPTPYGKPKNLGDAYGYFVWLDEINNAWNVAWSGDGYFTGTIKSSGNFYRAGPSGNGSGAENITTTDKIIYFDGYDDGLTGLYNGINFSSGNEHFIFDMAVSETSNRVSLFHDGMGSLLVQVYDNQGEQTDNRQVGRYVLSTDISNWTANELHQVAITWAFNSASETDELHLFVDGQEVPNLFKYGIYPLPTNTNLFGDVAQEVIVNSASKTIIGASDGQTTSSTMFYSASSNFSASGVSVGDTLNILDATQDGTASPNNGAAYIISGVGTTSLLLNRPTTLTLDNVSFSVNQLKLTVQTPINYENFIVLASGTELPGIEAVSPYYSTSVGPGNTQILTITNGVSVGDQLTIETLGLTFRECIETSYVYDGYQIRTMSAEPVALNYVKATMINLPPTPIFGSVTFDAYFSQPTNDITGKSLTVTLSGENINFAAGATVTITGNITQILTFASGGAQTTSGYFTNISSIVVNITPYNINMPAGAITVQEALPITVMENNGNYAVASSYENGLFSFVIYGSGGMTFNLSPGLYQIEYPTYLRVRIDQQPDTFVIGNNYNYSAQFDGVIDEFRILRTLETDTRVGDVIPSGVTTITTDYNNISPFTNTVNTILLAHFDDNLIDSSVYRDSFGIGYELDPSLNSSFDTAIRLNGVRPYIISNSTEVFNTTQGTIEFWINPLEDILNDPNYRYYVDISSTISENDTSITSTVVVAQQKIRSVLSVRLATDTFGLGTNYYSGGSVSAVDGVTITLGTPLPAQNTPVVIIYTPLSQQGDRVSIYKDPNGYINFFVTANNIDHVISTPVNWQRHTWHRVMVMYSFNSSNGQDTMRLFVDGTEGGVIKYGTGLLYGSGVIYGQEEVRSGVTKFIVDQISLTDSFSQIYIGTDVFGVNPAFALMDNLRFSNIQRNNSIAVVGGNAIDLNYTSNPLLAVPVLTDDYTTGIYNFDDTSTVVQYFAEILNADSGIFKFDVEVIDSFDKITGNTYLETLLTELINVIKPCNTTAIVTFDR